jgi:hypothetical protein
MPPSAFASTLKCCPRPSICARPKPMAPRSCTPMRLAMCVFDLRAATRPLCVQRLRLRIAWLRSSW